MRVEPCREDDRRKLLYGTEKGRQLLEAMHAADLKAQDWLQQTFTPTELTALEHLQGKLLRSLIQLSTSNPKKRHQHMRKVMHQLRQYKKVYLFVYRPDSP